MSRNCCLNGDSVGSTDSSSASHLTSSMGSPARRARTRGGGRSRRRGAGPSCQGETRAQRKAQPCTACPESANGIASGPRTHRGKCTHGQRASSAGASSATLEASAVATHSPSTAPPLSTDTCSSNSSPCANIYSSASMSSDHSPTSGNTCASSCRPVDADGGAIPVVFLVILLRRIPLPALAAAAIRHNPSGGNRFPLPEALGSIVGESSAASSPSFPPTASRASLTCSSASPLSSFVPLITCPLTGSLCRIPARGRNCRHRGCFDLLAFLEAMKNQLLWRCPICRTPLPYAELETDANVLRVILKLATSFSISKGSSSTCTSNVSPFSVGQLPPAPAPSYFPTVALPSTTPSVPESVLAKSAAPCLKYSPPQSKSFQLTPNPTQNSAVNICKDIVSDQISSTRSLDVLPSHPTYQSFPLPHPLQGPPSGPSRKIIAPHNPSPMHTTCPITYNRPDIISNHLPRVSPDFTVSATSRDEENTTVRSTPGVIFAFSLWKRRREREFLNAELAKLAQGRR
eukprot:GHVT01033030.1.p1 GENE.GHVT01033030.1~~GHVT01033030.1.p1  ORF type:complete len:518 (-),score=56.47 GHVT01033030.1:2615-4168(-)